MEGSASESLPYNKMELCTKVCLEDAQAHDNIEHRTHGHGLSVTQVMPKQEGECSASSFPAHGPNTLSNAG